MYYMGGGIDSIFKKSTCSENEISKLFASDFVVLFVESSVLYCKGSVNPFARELNGLKCYILKKVWFDEEQCSNSCYSRRIPCLFYRHKENVSHNTRDRIIRKILRLFISILPSYSEFKLCSLTSGF